MRSLALLLFVSLSASAATLTLDSVVTGTVRFLTDPAGVNRFSSSTGTLTNLNPPSAEFAGTIDLNGVPFTVSADFNRFVNTVLLVIDLNNSTDTASIPPMIFSFSNLQFTPLAVLTSVTFNGGTPGAFGAPVVTGPDSFTVTTNSLFLSNGGSAGTQFLLRHTEVPEPATFSMLGLAAGLAAAVRLTRRT